MSGHSYSTEILICAEPDMVYKAINEEIDKWWTELSNPSTVVGDRLSVQFEMNTFWVMTVSEANPNRSLDWEVFAANHNLDNLSKKDEWKRTTIKWKIVGNKNGSKVNLIHQGLMPALECFEICQAGWKYFLGSLKDYLETGKGYPYKKTNNE